MDPIKNILIIGGGIGGLTSAVLLARQGFHVELIEQAPQFLEIGAGIQLSPNAMRVMDHISLSAAILAQGVTPAFAILKDYKNGRTQFKTPLNEASPSSAPYIHIHRAALIDILVDAAQKSGVEFHMGQKVSHIAQHSQSVTAQTEDGASYSGDILIGADGINSTVRHEFFDKHKADFTQQVAWRGIIDITELSDNDMGAILEKNTYLWMGPDGHFVAYYIRTQKRLNFVAIKERADWQEQSWTQKGNIDALKAEFANWDNTITQLLNGCQTTYLWGLFDRPPLACWSKNRVSLLGDAAHPMLPFMAQGAAMAIEDSWVLTHALCQNPNQAEAAFSFYEKIRAPRTTRLQALSRANAKFYHTKAPSAKIWRNMQLRVGQHLPLARKIKFGWIYSYDVTEKFPLQTTP